MAPRFPFVLYRMFDHQDRLIYVGRTINPPGRFAEHRAEKDWWDEIERIHLERLPTEQELLEAEREAIHSERPLYNIKNERPVRLPGDPPPPRNPAGPEATRRMRAMDHQWKKSAFMDLRKLGAWGYTQEQLDYRIKICRDRGVSEDDIAWACENMYLDQSRPPKIAIARRLAETDPEPAQG